MADDKLSAREAALIAQARAEAQQRPAARADAAAVAASARTEAPAPPAAPAANSDPAERIAALMEIARAESERLRRKQRQLYVWAPVAFMSVLGLWALAWLWHML